MKPELTRSRRLGRRAMRLIASFAVLVVAVGGGYAMVAGSATPPKPPWSPESWVHWWNADPVGALVLVFAALSSAGALFFGAYPVLWSKEAKEAAARLVEAEARLGGKVDALRVELLQALARAQAPGAPPPTADSTASTERAADELVRSDDSADRRAADLISKGEVAAGLAILSEAALAADRDAAERWRRLGALAYSDLPGAPLRRRRPNRTTRTGGPRCICGCCRRQRTLRRT